MRASKTAAYWAPLVIASALVGSMALAGPAQAQNNQFGGQDRANAAARMIVLGVQQGISSLPPTAGQSFTYEFNPQLDTYVTSERLGPTSFRTPQTIGAGTFSFRMAASYFELADSFAPIPYLVNDQTGTPLGVAELGLRANAHVGLVNIGGSYGFSNRFEMMLNLPVVVVDANATQIFTTTQPTGPARQAPLSGPGIANGDIAGAVQGLRQALQPGGGLFLREESFSNLGFDFNEGTHVGVGRISIGAKGVLYGGSALQIAAMPEFFFPSPSEDQFAGSGSAAILPRLVGAYRVADPFRLHLDAGYDYDFDSDELRRFVWNAGASIPITNVTFDFGVGGSKFNQGIKWTPSSAPFVDPNGNPGTIQVLRRGMLPGNFMDHIGEHDNTLGSNFVDALGGIKVRVAEKTILSGAVNVPLNNEGFRAAAVGTIAVEQYF